MAARVCFGVETEYAGVFTREEGLGAEDRDAPIVEVIRDVRARVPYLPGGGSCDSFLANGARLYVDAGAHIELATAECGDPADLVCQVAAGDRLLGEACAKLTRDGHCREASLRRGNVDYSGSNSTWGSHECHLLLHGSLESVAPNLVGHLVSRIVFTGSGGFQNHPVALKFALSPRSFHFVSETSSGTQENRGIINTRDEPLGSSGRRMHLICGESLCSRRAMFLRVATTALITSLLDHGLTPKRPVRFARPVPALHAFSADHALIATARDVEGTPLTAVGMQRRYLEFVEEHAGSDKLPDWAPATVALWRETLDSLEQDGPAGAASWLDWAIKHALYTRWIEADGHTWESLGKLAGKLTRAYNRRANVDTPHGSLLERDGFGQFAEWAGSHGVCERDTALRYFELRLKLLEADTRFGRLGDGMFAQLEERGLVDQRAPGVDEARIQSAMRFPPKGTRARARGLMIHRLARKPVNGTYSCSWSGIYDMHESRRFDLADSFARWSKWSRVENSRCEEGSPFDVFLGRRLGRRSRAPGFMLSRLNAQVLEQYDRGNYERGAELLSNISDRGIERSGEQAKAEYYRFASWIHGRRGDLEAALLALAKFDIYAPHNLSGRCDHACCHLYLGLTPHRRIDAVIAEGLEMMENPLQSSSHSIVPFLGHAAGTFLRRGNPDRALALLEQARESERFPAAHPHTQSRILALSGDAHRMLGDDSRAWADASRARTIAVERRFNGDLADFALTHLAKIQSDRGRAVRLLQRALEIQRSLGNEMGEARSLILLARMRFRARETSTLRSRLEEIRGSRTALQSCPMFGRIVNNNWDAWVTGAPDPHPGGIQDDYWCL